MKKGKLYLITFLSLLLIVSCIAYFLFSYVLKNTTEYLLKAQMESIKHESKQIASLLSYQFDNNLPKEDVLKNVQQSIENTHNDSGYISIFDWSGKELCHPNISRIGQYTLPEKSLVTDFKNNATPSEFYDYLERKKIRVTENSEENSEIVYVCPVKNTDWIIAGHVNIDKISLEKNAIKKKFFLIFILSTILIVLTVLTFLRFIVNQYEVKIIQKNEELSDRVIDLTMLNKNLIDYKTKLNESLNSSAPIERDKSNETETKHDSETEIKQRILVHYRDEILPIPTQKIALIYTENSITYIVTLENNRYTSNNSLDDILKKLNKSFFYRANRQYIISIHSINKIIKYGNNQLKIETLPKSEDHILISKNKVANFKEWLNS